MRWFRGVAALVALAASAAEADVTAARWTLRMGGRVTLTGQSSPIRSIDELPPGDFTLAAVDWAAVNAEPEDLARLAELRALVDLKLPGPLWNRNADRGKDLSKELAHLRAIDSLRSLTFTDHFLDRIRFRDAGLEAASTLTSLRTLAIRQAEVTGKGLAPFVNLETLDITLCPVDDRGFASIAGMKKLRRLWARDTLITSQALENIASITTIEDLDLQGTRVGDDGVRYLSRMTHLRRLNLESTDVTDQSLRTLSALPIEELNLYRSKVSAAGLEYLKRMTTLRSLDLRYTRISAAAVAELRAALPNARISAAGGATIARAVPEPPRSGDERAIASWIRRAGGSTREREGKIVAVSLRGTAIQDRHLATLAALKHLEVLDLEATEAGDGGMPHLAGLALIELRLDGTAVSDEGVTSLAKLTSLRRLSLANTYVDGSAFSRWPAAHGLEELNLLGCAINDDAVVSVTRLRGLRSLTLAETDITSAAVAHLKTLTQLRELDLAATDIDDTAVAIGELTGLESLRLRDARITDALMPAVARLTALRVLDLGRTRLTNKGLEALGALASLRRLNIEYSEIDDAGLAAIAKSSSIEELNLDSTHVGDGAIGLLSGMKALRSLDLYHSLVTETGAASIRAALPNCQLRWDPAARVPTRRRA